MNRFLCFNIEDHEIPWDSEQVSRLFGSLPKYWRSADDVVAVSELTWFPICFVAMAHDNYTLKKRNFYKCSEIVAMWGPVFPC